jgi:hypothetical protein
MSEAKAFSTSSSLALSSRFFVTPSSADIPSIQCCERALIRVDAQRVLVRVPERNRRQVLAAPSWLRNGRAALGSPAETRSIPNAGDRASYVWLKRGMTTKLDG